MAGIVIPHVAVRSVPVRIAPRHVVKASEVTSSGAERVNMGAVNLPVLNNMPGTFMNAKPLSNAIEARNAAARVRI
jgi:hypothetical protein